MIRHRGYRPVVVGVDASACALDALDWAAAEAATRELPLRVVHACVPPATGDPYGVLAAAADDRAYRQAGQEVLDEAVSRARSVAPECRISARLVIGPPAQAILEHARDAELVVVGNGRTGRLRRLLARSVGGQVVAHAGCPVAVVPAFHEVPPGPSAARVVVGIDARSTDAAGYAFQAAEQRGIVLTAVHAWVPRGPAEPEGAVDDTAAGEEAGRRLLDDALERWIDKFPGVRVEPRLVRGHAAHTLVAESAGAALTVVGTRGRGCLRGALLGSVSRALLRHAHSPVAVLRTPP
ncbi:MAG TPA: universal stress protein [Pseudonocardia sp.]|nr:universal stress protein [Pseudonocardia sp.]